MQTAISNNNHSHYLALTIIQTTQSKDTERVTTSFTLSGNTLHKKSLHWGAYRDTSQQVLALSPQHFEDLGAYLELSWDNLQGEVYHPIIKGNMGKVHVEIEATIHWEGQQAHLQLSSMKENILKDRHYLSAILLADYLDKYFTKPNSFRALEWIKAL
ncbi:MAG: hypothetical protein KTR30_11255 [Saprospiraceae bacterium]|nr:hypothetical protein [Saprospiraceae bacterium]